jgi:biotin transport system substrate-specific component
MRFTNSGGIMVLNTHRNHTVVDAITRTTTLTGNALLALAGSLLIAALAQIAVPVGPVPISGQTLGVLLVAAVLGPRRGAWAVLLYLAEGTMGLPVFAGGRAGLMVLMGPTGGYLVGFVAAALVVGTLCEAGMDRRPTTTFITMLAGSAAIYLFGVVWLARFTGWNSVLQFGVYPFLFGDALKAAIAAVGLPMAWSFIRK